MSALSRRQLLAASAGLVGGAFVDKAFGKGEFRPQEIREGARAQSTGTMSEQVAAAEQTYAASSGSFNPLQEKGIPLERQLRNWSELNVKPYNAQDVPAYSRCRVITLNGIEVESVLFSHQYARHTTDLDLKRQLAFVRRVEQQQQKAVNWLIPAEESTLEVTIGYEQVAVDLTAWVARHEPNPYARQAYEFGLLEDFDHLYR